MSSKSKYIFFIFIISICSCSSNPIFNKNDLPKDVVITKVGSFYSVIPKCYEMTRAIIYYPGGLIEPESYLPLMAKLANDIDIAVFIQTMPFNLAIFGKNSANKILKKYNYIDEWYISGHSLGGVIASSYLYNNRDTFDGLILFASYPMDKKPLTDVNIPVLSIRATEDLTVDKAKVKSTKMLLPQNTQFKVIEGGNHAQFGSYGIQKADGKPLISEEIQHNIIIDYVYNFIFSE